MGLRPLSCWDCDFKSRWMHGCLFLVNAASCAGTGLCDGPISRPGKSYRTYVISCDQVQQHYNEQVEEVTLTAIK